MIRRRILGVFFAGSIAALAAVGPAFASCQCDITAESRWFTLYWHDTCPGGSTTEEERRQNEIAFRRMCERQAHGVAFVAACWRALAQDSTLRHLTRSRVELLMSVGGRIYSNRNPDLIVSSFRQFDRDTVATLFAVRLGRFSTLRAAKAAMSKWRFLHRRRQGIEEEPGVFDSLLSILWKTENCSGEWSADLYVLPPGLSPSRRHDVYYGLFIDRGDANRIATRLRRHLKVKTEVQPILATGEVIGIAIAESPF